jgi:hypothetical protein
VSHRARRGTGGRRPAAAFREGDGESQTLPWRLNQSSALVGYRYDEEGRLIGESWVPRSASLDEFQFVVRLVATQCDRMELRITGEGEY